MKTVLKENGGCLELGQIHQLIHHLSTSQAEMYRVLEAAEGGKGKGKGGASFELTHTRSGIYVRIAS